MKKKDKVEDTSKVELVFTESTKEIETDFSQ